MHLIEYPTQGGQDIADVAKIGGDKSVCRQWSK
jgi:hypothetical protein